ncbi:MAG: hypothetical protein IJX40_06375 [Alistipes sp.]|nr:hypothetical protein [Alistipes sp.]
MKITTNPIVGGGYEAPEIEVVSAVVERGFEASLEAGTISDAITEDWGTL